MRGKIVNLCIGFMNLLLGLVVLYFTTYVPQDITLITVQEGTVIKYILFALYAATISTAFIDLIQSYQLRTDTAFNTGYWIGVFSLCFLFLKQPIIAAFSIISGLIVLFKSIKENLVELNSTTAISTSIVIISVILITALGIFNYKAIGQSIKRKENKNQTAYTDNYFKYITELGIDEPYINVCKQGKFGYITPQGEVKIDFTYDYASPFVDIEAFDKHFQVALVCKDNNSLLILKNQRVVMTYRSESAVENYGAKLEELKDIYKNTLKQKGKMHYEIDFIDSNIEKANAYVETSDDYTYRYDYNEEYDLIVTQSNMGLGDKYEFAKKDDKNIRIPLNANSLDYDSSYLYLFSNRYIPCYDISKKTQGWFTSYGKKDIMTGKAQILDFFGDRILLRNYNNHTVYFIDNNYQQVSDSYKDIYICPNNNYIVESEDSFYKVIDDDYNKVFDTEYAVINPRLISKGLYLALDSTERIKFNDYGYPIMSWKLLNEKGELLGDEIEYIYDQVYKEHNEKTFAEDNYLLFVNDLKQLDYKFVGDKFYRNY